MSNSTPQRFGRRSLAVGAVVVGFGIGGFTLASAAQGTFLADNSSSVDLSAAADASVSADVSVTAEVEVEVSTPNTIDDSTDSTEVGDDNGVDDPATHDVGDDHGTDSDDNSTTTTGLLAALPDPFTKTYVSAGGSITVTWTGTAFVLDSVSAGVGFNAEIEDQRWDRLRVRFHGQVDTRIEVRISDDDNSLRVKIG
ncbi:MAG TPA: hypothetical protein PLV13_03845 [Ilumatobacteraceae bacterium]|nr:hypothetical protein [Ilumatobacteraceae bacterium]